MSENTEVMVPSDVGPAVLGPDFWSALQWASTEHQTQDRKGKPKVPYVSHLLGVASLVLEAGGTETQAVAALLHDIVEDQDVTPEQIRARYGERVERIVLACTDDLPGSGEESTRDEADWSARKQEYLAHLAEEHDEDILIVSGADKLHNARAIVADLRAGAPALTSFNAPPDKQLWYYKKLDEILVDKLPAYLRRELRAAIEELTRLTNLPLEAAAWNAAHSP